MVGVPHDEQLEVLKYRSVDRLLMADVFDLAAFAELDSYICIRAVALNVDVTLPKQLLACIVGAIGAIQTRAEYLPEVAASVHLAARFTSLLHALIASETCDQRRPGVPRIV